MRASIQNKTNDIREILWMECVTWSFAHVTSYSQRNFLYFCVGTVTAGSKKQVMLLNKSETKLCKRRYTSAYIMTGNKYTLW